MPAPAARALTALTLAPETSGIHHSLRRGLEKECLRVNRKGILSQKPHPRALGSALTHPQITIDFSEAQLELITGVHASISELLGELADIQHFVYTSLNDDELLWAASMPCVLGGDNQIPIGQFGSSNIGRIKHLYRLGLSLRYGRIMQTICGIHFNFSLADEFWHWLRSVWPNSLSMTAFKTHRYLDLIRNFRRRAWLLIYLFGASPAVCKTFVAGRPNPLVELDYGTLTLPHATSLRMGNLGYQSDTQASLLLSCNSLHSYTHSLRDALIKPYPPYQALGIRNDGHYLQLHTSLLQIENEFYGDIRPKQSIHPGERPLNALLKRGIKYIEVRCLDLNPFLPLGIDSETIRFLDVFLLHCLLTESPPDSPEEIHLQSFNRKRVVENGRDPSLLLYGPKGMVPATALGETILTGCATIARILDRLNGDDACKQAVETQKQRLTDPEQTPASRILATLTRQQVPFFRFAMNQSCHYQALFRNRIPGDGMLERFRRTADSSHARQAAMEAADEVDFETFRANYIAQVSDALSSEQSGEDS